MVFYLRSDCRILLFNGFQHSRPRSFVLQCGLDGHLQLFSTFEGEIHVSQKLSTEQNGIGFALVKDIVGLLSVRDQSDSTNLLWSFFFSINTHKSVFFFPASNPDERTQRETHQKSRDVLLDVSCEWDLVSRTERNLLPNIVATRTDIDEIYTEFLELLRQDGRLLQTPAVVTVLNISPLGRLLMWLQIL